MGWIAQGAGERWAATGSDKAWMGELTFWLWSAVWKPVGVEDTGCNPQSVHKTKLIITKPHSNHFRMVSVKMGKGSKARFEAKHGKTTATATRKRTSGKLTCRKKNGGTFCNKGKNSKGWNNSKAK